MNIFFTITLAFSFLFGLLHSNEKKIIRIGHFPNVTHAQGVIGHALTRLGKGWFEERLGKDVEIQWYVYDAGSSAMEGIFADSIDLAYVGPSPSINAFIRSNGELIRIVAGASSGGASLIVHKEGNIKKDEDFKGKRIGTPEFGNTQDIAARFWLKSLGLHITQVGGDAIVIPTSQGNQILLFKKNELDAVWTIEPWASNLVINYDGKVYLEEKDLWRETNGKYVTTHLVSNQKFLKENPILLKKVLLAHLELTEWIKTHEQEAKELLTNEIKKETNIALPKKVLDRAWEHFELTYDPITQSLFKYAEEAYSLGFIKEKPQLARIYDLTILNEILKEKKLNPIESYAK